MIQKILEMSNIKKTYIGINALNNVCFELNKGEVHILTGDNGSGKSTLLKILSGAEKMDSGEIRVFGQVVNIASTNVAQELGISIVNHEDNLIDFLSIAENIFLGKEPFNKKFRFIKWHILKTRTRVILDMLGLKFDVNTPVSELSEGERQILKIAKALSFDSKIIGMDEPSSSLSKIELENLFKLIKVLKIKGIGIIYVPHRLEETYRVGDRVSILKEGVLICTESVKEIPKSVLIKRMIGSEIKQEVRKAKYKKAKQAIRLENVCGKYKVKNVNLEIYQGEIFGIYGLVGSGKTELAKILFGIEEKVNGSIFINEEKVDFNSPNDAIRAGIGFLSEERNCNGLIPEMNVVENITLPNLRVVVNNGFIMKKKEKEIIINHLDKFKIRISSLDEAISNLYSGDQKKILISRWMFTDSKIIIFDEITRNIDISAKLEINDIIKNLTSNEITIIIISSDINEVLKLCDRIAVMCEGTITGIISSEEATQEKIVNLSNSL